MGYQDYIVITKETGLSVRKGPGKNSPIVGTLKKGTRVTVKDSKTPWKQLTNGRWVHGDYLSPALDGPNMGDITIQLRGIIPNAVKSRDNQSIPLPTKLIQKINLHSKIVVNPWVNGNTYHVLISHPSISGDDETLLNSLVGGISGGAAKAFGTKLSWTSIKALGILVKQGFTAVVGVAGGLLAPTHLGIISKPITLKFNDGLTVMYFICKK